MQQPEFYRCKARLGNFETYIKVEEKLKNKLTVTHFFKSGMVHEEEWVPADIKKLKKEKQLTKVADISWKSQGEEECQVKKPLKKKVSPKKKLVKKTTLKKKVLKKK